MGRGCARASWAGLEEAGWAWGYLGHGATGLSREGRQVGLRGEGRAGLQREKKKELEPKRRRKAFPFC